MSEDEEGATPTHLERHDALGHRHSLAHARVAEAELAEAVPSERPADAARG